MGERAARACTRNAVGVGEHARAHKITKLQLILLIWVQCKAHLIMQTTETKRPTRTTTSEMTSTWARATRSKPRA